MSQSASRVVEARRKAEQDLQAEFAVRYEKWCSSTESDFEYDLKAFISRYALPIFDAHAEAESAATRPDLESYLTKVAGEIIEDLLPNRSLESQLKDLPEDTPDEEGKARHMSESDSGPRKIEGVN